MWGDSVGLTSIPEVLVTSAQRAIIIASSGATKAAREELIADLEIKVSAAARARRLRKNGKTLWLSLDARYQLMLAEIVHWQASRDEVHLLAVAEGGLLFADECGELGHPKIRIDVLSTVGVALFNVAKAELSVARVDQCVDVLFMAVKEAEARGYARKANLSAFNYGLVFLWSGNSLGHNTAGCFIDAKKIFATAAENFKAIGDGEREGLAVGCLAEAAVCVTRCSDDDPSNREDKSVSREDAFLLARGAVAWRREEASRRGMKERGTSRLAEELLRLGGHLCMQAALDTIATDEAMHLEVEAMEVLTECYGIAKNIGMDKEHGASCYYLSGLRAMSLDRLGSKIGTSERLARTASMLDLLEEGQAAMRKTSCDVLTDVFAETIAQFDSMVGDVSLVDDVSRADVEEHGSEEKATMVNEPVAGVSISLGSEFDGVALRAEAVVAEVAAQLQVDLDHARRFVPQELVDQEILMEKVARAVKLGVELRVDGQATTRLVLKNGTSLTWRVGSSGSRGFKKYPVNVISPGGMPPEVPSAQPLI